MKAWKTAQFLTSHLLRMDGQDPQPGYRLTSRSLSIRNGKTLADSACSRGESLVKASAHAQKASRMGGRRCAHICEPVGRTLIKLTLIAKFDTAGEQLLPPSGKLNLNPVSENICARMRSHFEDSCSSHRVGQASYIQDGEKR
ncbi:uncharacterized protein LOC131184683 [Ahaetulla prasina]|uniref:uncharacterized protein LOC131184683 n=1 Tax=Ahaetulla prasina TaxID=499056 RepID=UPI002647CF0B|nr:uncharacterized protein LOC131184683 [Ahaetulla prasina]